MTTLRNTSRPVGVLFGEDADRLGRRAHDAEGLREVNVEHRLELLVGHLLDGSNSGVAGVVDDDVEPAELSIPQRRSSLRSRAP